jgi:hypothetical protein
MDKAAVDEDGTSNSFSAMVRNAELYIHTYRHLHRLNTVTNSHSPRPRGTHTQYTFTSSLRLIRFQRFGTIKHKNYLETVHKVDQRVLEKTLHLRSIVSRQTATGRG